MCFLKLAGLAVGSDTEKSCRADVRPQRGHLLTPIDTETIRPSPEPAQEPPRRGRKASTTREQALEILRNHAKMNGGALFASKAAIAGALGVSRTTVCDPRKGWVARWERTGAIELTKTRTGISVSVADNMAA